MREELCMWVFIRNPGILVLGERQHSLINFNCFNCSKSAPVHRSLKQFGPDTACVIKPAFVLLILH